jgi:streptomycin 6-kinase
MPLHVDLHHSNVLDAGPRGWLAIDPKALLGERTYETANLLRNPWPHGDIVHSSGRMDRLAAFYAERLNLQRAECWLSRLRIAGCRQAGISMTAPIRPTA